MSLTYRALLLLSLVASVLAQDRLDFPVTTSHIVYHDVKTDATGAIVPWYNERPSVAYDHDLRLVWKPLRSRRLFGHLRR